MQTTITFSAETTKNFSPNHKRGSQYRATIQNNTGQSVTITVSNQRGTSPLYGAPVTALVIADGAFATTEEPYNSWLLTAAASASGTVNIVEAS